VFSFVSLGNRLALELPVYAPRLQSMGIPFPKFIEESTGAFQAQSWVQDVGPTQALKTVTALAAQFGKSISATLLVIILTSFFLFEAIPLKNRAQNVFGDSPALARLQAVSSEIQHYLAIKTLTSALTGVLIACWTALMGIPFALLWGLIGFLLNYIPVVGSFVAAIPALLVCLAQFGVDFTLVVAIGYMVVNVGVSNVVEPVLMGSRLGLSPTAVFLSLVIWGYLWGPAGMLLSVPLTMVALIALENIEGMEWIPGLVTTQRRAIGVRSS
jgi:predicted PurR-regulated permease PerM